MSNTELNIRSIDDLKSFLAAEVITTNEAAEILDCTRQNIKRLVDNGKLEPLRSLDKDRLFLRADILERKENMNKAKAPL